MNVFAVEVMSHSMDLGAAFTGSLPTPGMPFDMTLDLGAPFAWFSWVAIAGLALIVGAVIGSASASLRARLRRSLRSLPVSRRADVPAHDRVTDAA